MPSRRLIPTSQLFTLAQKYWPEDAVVATAIALAESDGYADAHNDTAATGDNSYGLWQVNMYGDLGPDRRQAFDLQQNTDLFDPETNAKAARAIYEWAGHNWKPWGAWTNDSYKDYLPEARKARDSMTAPEPCNFPGRVITVFDRRFYVHEGIVEDLKWIEQEWRKRGGHDAYPIRADSGAYNCRKTTSGSHWSEHSRGWAVDINWDTNPFQDNDGTMQTDMPRWFVNLWKARGFGWGGDWSSVKDPMHFSKAPREGGDGRLSTAPVQEDDEMPTPEDLWNHRIPNFVSEDDDDHEAWRILAWAHLDANTALRVAREARKLSTETKSLVKTLQKPHSSEFVGRLAKRDAETLGVYGPRSTLWFSLVNLDQPQTVQVEFLDPVSGDVLSTEERIVDPTALVNTGTKPAFLRVTLLRDDGGRVNVTVTPYNG